MNGSDAAPVPDVHRSDGAHLDALRRQVDESLDRCIGSPERVAFLMYPMDGNVGNHMMWLALVEYLEQRGIGIAYAANRKNFRVDALRRAIGRDDPILFSGGVTMSRLWPAHTDMKRTVARAFGDNRLVSLTSTMNFVDADDAAAAADIFGDHPDVIVMARDPVSAENARRVFSDRVAIVTAPDSAFALQSVPIREPASRPVIWLARDDHERSGADAPSATTTFDWSSDLERACPAAHRLLRRSRQLSRVRTHRYTQWSSRLIDRLITRQYVAASRALVEAGSRTLDDGEVLVTDRLHPHVLAALRGQHVVLLPDRYGKNRAVYDYSTSVLDCVHWADDPSQAYELATGLARGDR